MECDMTKGPAARLVLSFTIPLFFGNLFQQLYAMVDTIIVGRFVGVEALAAVGATGGFSFMVIGFAQGLTAGFSVIISQRFGAKDMDGVRKAFAQSFICSALLSLLLAAVFGFLSMPLLRLIQTPENIISDANDYILIIYLGIGTSIFYNLFSSILRAVGDGKSPVIFLLISSALNVVLDLFFVITVPLACAGVAIATVLAQGISAVISLIYIWKRFPMFRIRKDDWSPDIRQIGHLLRIGIPGAVQFSVCAVGVIIVQIAINGFGSDAVAAYSVGSKIETLMTQFFPALGMAISTYAGQNLGALDFPRIRRGFRTAFIIMAAGAAITSLLSWLLADPLTGLFLDREATAPEIIAMSEQYVHTVLWFFIPLGMIFLYRTGCQGLGSGAIPMISSLIELGMRCMAAFTLPLAFGYAGICFASPFAWLSAGLVLPFFYFRLIRNIEGKYARQLTRIRDFC